MDKPPDSSSVAITGESVNVYLCKLFDVSRHSNDASVNSIDILIPSRPQSTPLYDSCFPHPQLLPLHHLPPPQYRNWNRKKKGKRKGKRKQKRKWKQKGNNN
ncbi:hypothetical protein P3L10_013036 [Capsicum annuum]